MKLNQILILALSAFFALACKKEEGPVGPQGPEGETGNANVQSQIITVSSAEWDDEGTWYSFTTPCDIITEEIQENGAVMAYQRGLDNSVYTALPVSATFLGDTVTTHVGFEHTVKEVYFFIQVEDGNTPAPGERTYKVVAIESSGLATNPGVNLGDYEEVKQAYDLTE
ncbi:MAG: hypothetical protein WED10_01400 [Brumimicrobium sp.]